jgi:single-strand DNA-binding protein
MPLNNLNHITATGYLTDNPTLRSLPSGHQICEMRLASNRSWKNELTGKWESRTDYFDVRVFGPFSDIAHRCLKKGSGVAIDGRLSSSGVRRNDPEHRPETIVLAEHMQFISNVSSGLRKPHGEAPLATSGPQRY